MMQTQGEICNLVATATYRLTLAHRILP